MAVPTPETRVTAGDVLAATGGKASGERVTSADVLVALNFPSLGTRVTEADGIVTVKSNTPLRVTDAEAQIATFAGPNLRVTEAVVLVAVHGRIANPKLRAWTFSLDGHDFYVLRLGMDLTLVYDVYSGQWMDWDAQGEAYWPVNLGINWVGGTSLLDTDGSSFGSNVLVGDDTYGLLWFLDPETPYDESPEVADPNQERFFPRVIMGQMPMVGRAVLPCYAAWLTTDMGAPAYVGAGVTLSISDDAGVSFTDMGLVTVTPGNNSPELAWYSLGQIEAPGRLFMIVDDGAIARLDSMEMNDPDNKE